MADILLDTITDLLKLTPLLFLTYLVMEYMEKKFEDRTSGMIVNNRFGIPLAAILGALPQCGFSTSASELYCCGIISYATLITVYFSTSDEMLPLLLSNSVGAGRILRILGIKIVIAVIAGILTQLLFRKKNTPKISDACANENCHCEEHGILVSALMHTGSILLFIGLVSLVLNIVIEYAGMDRISALIASRPLLTALLIPLVGLIPNCAASVIITQMYLSGMIPASLLISGLCANSGVAMLVLFKNNPDLKENISTVGYVYLLSVITGVVLQFFSFTAI